MFNVECFPTNKMKGLFITFEGTEGCGKSTQVELLVQRLRALGYLVRKHREPGGTPIGEELRHTLKHSPHNHAMTAETELLLMNASRAQLVRDRIEEADRKFFERVAHGFGVIAAAEPERVKL